MSVLIRFAPASLSAEQYDESIRRLREIDPGEPEVIEIHNVVKR